LKRLVVLSLSLLLLLVLIPGCFTIQVPASNTVPQVGGTPPVIMEFGNNPATIIAGGKSTLFWNVTGATAVNIDQGIGQVPVSGTKLVSPSKSTVYTISATNSAGTVIRSSAIIIVTVPAATQVTASNPVINFTANHLGDTSWQLNWNVSNATEVAIQPDIGPVTLTGNTVVKVPSGQTKLYRLDAVNDWGWAYWQVMMATP